jgi:hypothetical protein
MGISRVLIMLSIILVSICEQIIERYSFEDFMR